VSSRLLCSLKTVLLRKQVRGLFATGKVKISIWLLANPAMRTDSGFRFLNPLRLTAVFSLLPLNAVV
jgi:hypothetical protein